MSDIEADISVGRIEGGWAYWCRTCKRGQGAMTGVNVLDESTIDLLVEMHEEDHRLGRAPLLPFEFPS